MSDTSILRNARQLDASLRLTLWLMTRYHISLPNVIGLVVGRSLLYPEDEDVAGSVDTAAALVKNS